MKASIISKVGGPSSLEYGELPTPKPLPNEVLIKLSASAINHVDIWVRTGSPAYSVSLPHIIGVDGAGTIEEVGKEAEGVSVGDRVVIMPGISCGECSYCLKGQDNQCQKFEILGTKRPGTYAEYVAVPDTNVVVLPDNISFETAASFPAAYLTAWHMLMGRAKLTAKENVLVMGASSGVSIAAIQIAKSIGARVFASTTSAEKVMKIRSAGADDVFIASGEKKISDWVMEKTNGVGVEVVVDHVGPATWESSMNSLAKYGRLVTCGSTTGPSVSFPARTLFGRDLSILGAKLGTQKEFQELCSRIFSGKIKPLIDKTFPLEQAAQAHEYMEARQQTGKILLKIS